MTFENLNKPFGEDCVTTSTVTIPRVIEYQLKCNCIYSDWDLMFQLWLRELTFYEKLDIGIDHFFRNLKKIF